MGCSSEIYLTKNNVDKEEWQELIKTISKYNGFLKSWNITIEIKNKEIRYHLNTNFKVPTTINNLGSFFIKQEEKYTIPAHYISLPTFYPIGASILDCINYSMIKKWGTLKYITIKFRKITEEKILSKVYVYVEEKNKLIKMKMLLGLPTNLLSIDFSQNKIFSYKKVPKYLDITKLVHTLKTDDTNASLQVDTFPYLEGNFYLNNNTIDFAKHTLILGSSGCGKSKYISSFIKNIHNTYQNNYKVVMIDPHAAIEEDIGGLGKTIDFKAIEDSINLFASTNVDPVAATELTLELLKSLISDQYNAKLERVLRHSIYLLIANNNFNFHSLKKVILEIEYRNELIKELKNKIPVSVIDFFLNDFNDLKTKSYGEAISPIISFIDEMEMVPVFNEENILYTLKDTITNNFLTLFSLDKTILGDKVTKTISGFIMQQLLTLIQSHTFKEHILFIIDEVAVIENPILCRFLSEARKYNLSLILAGQYFNQISPTLKESILANVINYYIFRISRIDASLLADSLEIKIPINASKSLAEQKEEKINLLSNLNNRECIVRISTNNILVPAFKAKTLDFTSIPRKKEKKNNIEKKKENNTPLEENFHFELNNINIKEILKQNSSSRLVVKE